MGNQPHLLRTNNDYYIVHSVCNTGLIQYAQAYAAFC